MINKIEVGKKYKKNSDIVEVVYIGADALVYKKEDKKEGFCFKQLALTNWNEIEQETITLTEYVCDDGCVAFLTENKEYISLGNIENNLVEMYLPEKCIKAPNARSYRVYADTLEPVEE